MDVRTLENISDYDCASGVADIRIRDIKAKIKECDTQLEVIKTKKELYKDMLNDYAYFMECAEATEKERDFYKDLSKEDEK